MNQKYNPALRVISTVILSFFLWTFGGLFEVAYAIKDREGLSVKSEKSASVTPTGVPLPLRPGESAWERKLEGKKAEEKFSKALEEIE